MRKRLTVLIFTAFISLSYSYSTFAETITLHPSDVVTAGSFTASGGSWSDILDANDGDYSFATACCGPGGTTFYVNLDDPSGLGGSTITGIDLYVAAKYLEGPWPGGVPYSGYVNIGFKTGTSTLWNGPTLTDHSGAYNIIQSNLFTTDSDGGALDFNDIANLQLAVQRNTYGPPQLKITELYADVHYTTSPVPLPGAILLFGTGLVGLATAGIRRKKKQ